MNSFRNTAVVYTSCSYTWQNSFLSCTSWMYRSVKSEADLVRDTNDAESSFHVWAHTLLFYTLLMTIVFSESYIIRNTFYTDMPLSQKATCSFLHIDKILCVSVIFGWVIYVLLPGWKVCTLSLDIHFKVAFPNYQWTDSCSFTANTPRSCRLDQPKLIFNQTHSKQFP